MGKCKTLKMCTSLTPGIAGKRENFITTANAIIRRMQKREKCR